MFFAGVQEKMGVINHSVVYALWDYEPQNDDELGFSEGDCLTVLSREDEVEKEWWWARCGDNEGYIPRNLLGVSCQSSPTYSWPNTGCISMLLACLVFYLGVTIMRRCSCCILMMF